MQSHRNGGEGATKPFIKQEQALDDARDDEEFLSFVEEDQTPPGKVVREFRV